MPKKIKDIKISIITINFLFKQLGNFLSKMLLVLPTKILSGKIKTFYNNTEKLIILLFMIINSIVLDMFFIFHNKMYLI